MKLRRIALPDLESALEWLRQTWEARETPSRLHERSFEGEGPFYTPAFARHLDAKPDDTARITTSRDCSHHRMKGDNVFGCPDCAGTGTYETTSWVFRYPMWRAMDDLSRENRKAHDRVLTLVINAYNVEDAMTVLHCREGHILDSIRALYSRYQRAPEGGRRVAWVDRSESQRNAEMQMAAVA